MDKIRVKSPVLFLSLVLSFLTLIFVIICQGKLPPVVPLLYGAAEGESQVVSSWALTIPALSSIILIAINSFLAGVSKDDFVKKVLIFSALIVTLFSVITTFKIILLVGELLMNISLFALLPALIAAALSFLFTFLVIRLAKRLKIIDDPRGKRHPKVIHKYPTPRGGGIAIFFAVAIASILFLPFDKHLLGILAGALVLTFVGLMDDRRDLNPYLRLGLGALAASLPIAAGIGISFISNPFGGGTIDLSSPSISFNFLGETRSIWILSDAFALIWMVFMMNMLNMGAKGVDGQLPGVVVVAAATIAALSLRFSADVTQWPVIVLASVVAGSYLGFLPWNFYPQKIMPGYGGSSLAGYFLAILSILATTKVGVLIVVLAVPLIDTGYTIARRLMSGKSPVWGDTGHLHHRLLAIGWGKRRVAIFYWGITLLLGILSLNLNTAFKFYTMVGVSVALGGLIIWLTYRR